MSSDYFTYTRNDWQRKTDADNTYSVSDAYGDRYPVLVQQRRAHYLDYVKAVERGASETNILIQQFDAETDSEAVTVLHEIMLTSNEFDQIARHLGYIR